MRTAKRAALSRSSQALPLWSQAYSLRDSSQLSLRWRSCSSRSLLRCSAARGEVRRALSVKRSAPCRSISAGVPVCIAVTDALGLEMRASTRRGTDAGSPRSIRRRDRR
jgi:hypothetical protein